MIEDIKKILGTPYYECKYGAIYNMDCEAALSQISNAVFSTTITSPPYNIGKAYEKVMPLNEYVNWLAKVSNHIYRLTKPNGSYLLNLGYLSIPEKGRLVALYSPFALSSPYAPDSQIVST